LNGAAPALDGWGVSEVVGVLAIGSWGEVALVLAVDEGGVVVRTGVVRLGIIELDVMAPPKAELHNPDSVSIHVLPGSQQPPWLQ